MTTEVFGEQYAATYDLVYKDKDYASECEAVCQLMKEFGTGPMKALLDIGCGTGRHAVHLCQSGYEIVGVDRSSAMLELANQRAFACHLPEKIVFHQSDIRALSLGRWFDAALIMFNVLGFMVTNDDLLVALRSIRRNVRPGGLLIGEVWYGPAVIANPPSDRTKEFNYPSGRIVRSSSTHHCFADQTCTVSIMTTWFKAGRPVEDTKEVQRVRYFFPLELDLALRATGFCLVALRAFPEVLSTPGLTKYPAIFVGVAQSDEVRVDIAR